MSSDQILQAGAAVVFRLGPAPTQSSIDAGCLGGKLAISHESKASGIDDSQYPQVVLLSLRLFPSLCLYTLMEFSRRAPTWAT